MKLCKTYYFVAIMLWLGQPSRAEFIKVAPAIVEIVADPGQKVRGKIDLTNPTEDMQIIHTEIQETWSIQAKLPTIPWEEWLKLRPSKDFKLGAGQSRPINYIVRAPDSFAGEAMVTVFISMIPPGEKKGGVHLRMRHGIPIYVIARGTEEIKVDASQPVSVDFTGETSSSSIRFSLYMKNTGNVHIRPEGEVLIYSHEAKRVGHASLDWGWPIFPNQEHTYTARTKETDWVPGYYQADIKINDGELHGRNPLVEEKVNFFIKSDRGIERRN